MNRFMAAVIPSVMMHSMASATDAITGLIVIGAGAGLDHAFKALRRFVKLSANIPDDRIVTLMGYAGKPGEVKSDQPLIEEARKLGGRMAEILTSAHSPEPA